MRVLTLILILAAVGFVGYRHYYVPPPGVTHSRQADVTQPFVVKIHADSCRKCIDLGPIWNALEGRVGGSTRMVVLDVTNEERFDHTQDLARYLGLTGFLREHMEQTGLIAVLHGATREPIAFFDGERDPTQYLRAVERARGSS